MKNLCKKEHAHEHQHMYTTNIVSHTYARRLFPLTKKNEHNNNNTRNGWLHGGGGNRNTNQTKAKYNTKQTDIKHTETKTTNQQP